MIGQMWHRLRGHKIIHRGRIQPDYSMGSSINVYVQDTFRPPMPHDECSCGKIWHKQNW